MSNPPTANDILRSSDQEARQLLRQRKRRERGSCHPCRTRKVKCDRSSPCLNCSKSGYPELCSYTGRSQPQSGLQATFTSTPAAPGLSRVSHPDGLDDAHPPLPTSTSSSIRATRSPEVGIEGGNDNRVSDNQGSVPRDPFLGANSLPSFLRIEGSQSEATQSGHMRVVEDAIIPILGLQGSDSAYPFLDSKPTSADRVQELRQALPVEREIIRLFRTFKAEVHPFSPIIHDVDAFELELCSYLEYWNTTNNTNTQRIHNIDKPESWRSVSWIGSLFAVLASGSQYCDLSLPERQAKSQLYVRLSFQCLRMANFLVRPSVLCIQTLLILGNVLQNDMKPEAAWILLGTTTRMAQSLGLHEENENLLPLRRNLWLALEWQDSLLSLCFDRPPVTIPSSNPVQLAAQHSYVNAMHVLCDRTLRAIITRPRRHEPDFGLVLDAIVEIEEIHHRVQASNGQPTSISQRCERSALSLHTSFVIAWLCRPALRRIRTPMLRTASQVQLVEKCTQHLLECVRAFVSLHSLSILASRSWAVFHNGLSSALLLGILGVPEVKSEVQKLQREVLNIISADVDVGNDREKNGEAILQYPRPYVRAIVALRKLYNDSLHSSAQPTSTVNNERRQEGFEIQAQPDAAFRQIPLVGEGFVTDPSFYDSLQLSETFGQDISPLDMFDSIWDPLGTNGFTSSYNDSSMDLGLF